MDKKHKVLFSNLTFENWRNLILAAIVCFYLISIIFYIKIGAVGDDFVAYWSIGRISNEKGFSQIYEIDNLRNFYSHELIESGYFFEIDDITYSVPYLPFFLLPFQFFSLIDLPYSYWLWNILNLVLLFFYLYFFLPRIKSGSTTKINILYWFVFVFASYPVFKNFSSGNVNVFLLICTGEFIRNAVNKKPILSGMWLGGMLLKPPLLILIIPIFLITRNWKVLKGFTISLGIILFTSIFLVGFNGIKSLMNLWIRYPSDTFSNTAPEIMINWRMVGLFLDNQLNISIGWVIMGLGIILTLFTLSFHKKQFSLFGNHSWVIAMLSVFSATLAITWHSHYYTAMILIPFIVYASVHKMIPEKLILLWGVVTPIAWLGTIIIGLFDYLLFNIGVIDFTFMVIAFSGFIMNLVILHSTVKCSNDRSLKQYSDPIYECTKD